MSSEDRKDWKEEVSIGDPECQMQRSKLSILAVTIKENLACVASVSARVRREKLGRGQKKKKKQEMTGKGEGKEGFLFSPPPSTSFFAPALTTLANCYTGSRGTGNNWG